MVEQFDILVITHGHLELTIRCINAIYQNTKTPFNLIVVDDSTPDLDNGTDLTPTWLARFRANHDDFTFIHSSKPYESSYPVIANAIKYCKTPYLALITNSMIVEPNWEIAAIELMRTNPNIGIIGFKQLDHKTGLIESAGLASTFGASMLSDIGQGKASHRCSQVYECDAVAWAHVLLRIEAIQKHVEAECLYHGWKGWEEIDLCLSTRQDGWKILYCGLSVGYHQARATRGFLNPDTDEARLANKQNLENREIFAKRWGYWDEYHKYSHLQEFFLEMKDRGMIVPPVTWKVEGNNEPRLEKKEAILNGND